MTAPTQGPDKSFIDLGIVEIDGKQFKAKLVYKDSTGRQIQDITHLNNAILSPEKRTAIKNEVQQTLRALYQNLQSEDKTLNDRVSIQITRDKINAKKAGGEEDTFKGIGRQQISEIFQETFTELNTLYERTPRANPAPAAQAQPQAPAGRAGALTAEMTIAPRTPLEDAQMALATKLNTNNGDLQLDARDEFDAIYTAINQEAEGAVGAVGGEGEAVADQQAAQFINTQVNFMAACLGLKATKDRGGNHTFQLLTNMHELQRAMRNENNRRLLKEYIKTKISQDQRLTITMSTKFVNAQAALSNSGAIGTTLTFTG